MNDKKLIFVYNAKSGAGNALLDFVHKTFRPETYDCNLCALTYPVAWKDPHWKQFLKSLPVDVEFEYRNTLEKKYHISDEPLPAVFIQDGDHPLSVWIDAETINRIQTLDELIQEIQGRMAPVEIAAI